MRTKRQFFEYNIDNVEIYSQKNLLICTGWMFSVKEKGSEINIHIDNMSYSIEKIIRNDVNKTYELKENQRCGFKIISKFLDTNIIKLQLMDEEDNKDEITINIKKEIIKKIKHNFCADKKKSLKYAVFHLLYALKTRETENYAYWIYKNENYDRQQILKEIQAFKAKPKISIVIPVYNVEERWLRRCVDSVKNQYYDNWEICIADDHSSNPEVKRVLEALKKDEPRIKVVYRKENGHISKATNTALEQATGDYIAFMDNDDELAPHALYENVKLINEHPKAAFIYSDEDKIDIYGKRFDPFFKPDWNSRLLLNHNYITHFVVVKRELFEKTGKLHSEMDGAQDYDFVLRATELTKYIYHIPKILYHWRTIEGSTADNPESKNYAYTAGKKAVEYALERRGYKDYTVHIGPYYGINTIESNCIKQPRVSVIFNQAQDAKQLAQSVDRLIKLTNYDHYEILCQKIEYTSDKIIMCPPEEKDHHFLNTCVQNATGDYLLFMTADSLPKEKDWLLKYINTFSEKQTDIKGIKIIDQEANTISAGLSISVEKRRLEDIHRGIPADHLGYYFRLVLPRNVQAVRLEGLLIEKKRFIELDGFEFSGDYGAVDLCLKAAQMNHTVVWIPDITFIRKEDRLNQTDKAFFEKWHDHELKNPYLNENVNKI